MVFNSHPFMLDDNEVSDLDSEPLMQVRHNTLSRESGLQRSRDRQKDGLTTASLPLSHHHQMVAHFQSLAPSFQASHGQPFCGAADKATRSLSEQGSAQPQPLSQWPQPQSSMCSGLLDVPQSWGWETRRSLGLDCLTLGLMYENLHPR